MSLPTNTRNITTVTNLAGTNVANTAWTFVNPVPCVNASPGTPLIFNRQVVLSQQGILFTRAGNSVGFLLEDLCLLAAKAQPAFTWAPVAIVQPASVGGTANAATSFISQFTDEFTGISNDIIYQWKFGSNNANVPASGPFTNVTTNTLNIANVEASSAAASTYYCAATNPSGTTNSNTVGIIDITAQPSNASVTHPAPATFSATAVSGLLLNYQWQANGVNIAAAGTANYSNWSTASLKVGISTGLNGTNYSCIVYSGSTNAATTNGVLLVA